MEKRSDVGQKIMIGLILGAFGTVVGLFVNHTLERVDRVEIGVHQNALDIRGVMEKNEGRFSAIMLDLSEIKSILKRTAPYERK